MSGLSLARHRETLSHPFQHPLEVLEKLFRAVGIPPVTPQRVSHITHEVLQSEKFRLSGLGEMDSEWGFGKGDRSLFIVELTGGAKILLATPFRARYLIAPPEERQPSLPAPEHQWYGETTGYSYNGKDKLFVYREQKCESTISIEIGGFEKTLGIIRCLQGSNGIVYEEVKLPDERKTSNHHRTQR